MIQAEFVAELTRDPEKRVSRKGVNWVRLPCSVGDDDDKQWVIVACFGEHADVVDHLERGARIKVRGVLKLNSWKDAQGIMRQSLDVLAQSLEPLLD